MRMCMNHWTMLRSKIDELGLTVWIAPNGEVAAQQMVSIVATGELTKVNYDPLMAANNMIMANSIEMAGPLLLGTDENGEEYCPICFLNSKRNEDGSCDCGQPECGGKEPGSIPPFEKWIDYAANGAKKYMVDQGWVEA